MQQVKKVPMRGTASEVAGVMLPTMPRKNVTDKRIVISSVIFSHDSGGIVKPLSFIFSNSIEYNLSLTQKGHDGYEK